jgi:CPA1 family monovalent cation:H+ antiporter
LALNVPASVPEHGTIVTIAFAVVAFSIFVQGLTMPWLTRRLGLQRPAEDASARGDVSPARREAGV